MKCENFKIRTRKGKRIFYCSLLKKEITFDFCHGCSNKKYKEYKKLEAKTEMKKKTYKLAKAEKNRYSLFTDDLDHCIENKDHIGHIDKHECIRGSYRLISMRYGLVVPLCRTCHDDPIIERKWLLKGQAEFVKKYGYEKFIDIFKINYIEKYKNK